jgi:protein SPT2
MIQIGDLLAQITGESSPVTTIFPSLPKRKADDELRRPSDKAQRTGSQIANSSKPINQTRKPSGSDTTKISQNGGGPLSSSPATATFKNGHLTPPPSTGPPKPPKKGSYAEIMARAKAAQSTLGQVGKIQHKQIETLPSRREREVMKAKKGKSIQKGLTSNSKFQITGQPAVASGKDGLKRNRKVVAEPEKKVKKAALATTGYAGTARPKPGGAASSKSGAGCSSRSDRDRYQKDRLGSRYDRYLSEDEEDEEMEDDIEQDYASDASSDMEAAAFEVDEEEELAARIARKEDAAALAEETRLKREKEEKKRRLMAMAKKASAKR